jgi:hypothetical protein
LGKTYPSKGERSKGIQIRHKPPTLFIKHNKIKSCDNFETHASIFVHRQFIQEEPKNTLLFDPLCPHLKEFTILSISSTRNERIRKIFITYDGIICKTDLINTSWVAFERHLLLQEFIFSQTLSLMKLKVQSHFKFKLIYCLFKTSFSLSIDF